MWLPIAAGLIGIAIYRGRKEGNPTSYPSWSGKVFNHSAVLFPFKFKYLKIDDDGEVRNKGRDQHGSFKTRGHIKNDGSVELKQTYYSGKRTIRWSGRIVGHNKIVGVWTMEKGGASSAQFEMQLDKHHSYLMRRHRNSDTFFDRICLALSPDRKKFRGLGIDQIGHYLVCGKLKDLTNIVGTINYFNKFVIHFKGTKNRITNEYEGDWTIKNGGSGKFNLRREGPLPQLPPFSQPFLQPAPPLNGYPVLIGAPVQPVYGYPPLQFSAQPQQLQATPVALSPFKQDPQDPHNIHYPTPIDD